MKIDFSYACGTPHRLCSCLPEASSKSLWDVSETGITLSWSDDDMTTQPLGAWKSPCTQWTADFVAEAGGSALEGKNWRRVDNWIPALEYTWERQGVRIAVTAVSAKDADVVRLRATNGSTMAMKTGVYGRMRKECVNTRWVDFDSPYNALMGHESERSDRIMFLVVDAPRHPPRTWSSVDVEWFLKAGEEQTAYVIRPHFALIDEIEAWHARDWGSRDGRGAAGVANEAQSGTPVRRT